MVIFPLLEDELLELVEAGKEPDELEEEPFSWSEPSCAGEENNDPSILTPGEYFPVDFRSLS